ncbi:MAG: hypothetical protein QF441_15175 [Bacteriovoracaceae bacterium]|jgi:hypothetical protein|nr:hypothetical protein [Halobacteriovoraceae bacterium]MDP7321948.1 hypothetical protein [Bacteriovoracaceae bacterium]|tara:strand:+ start:283 stop:483 length:201 start_codon:yes stop_codon:yes gene_type:complete
MKEDDGPNILKVVGLAVGLPSSILGVFGLVYYLIHEEIISTAIGLGLILAIIFYTFFLMLRYANKK